MTNLDQILRDKKAAGTARQLKANTDYLIIAGLPSYLRKNCLDSREIALLMFAVRSDISVLRCNIFMRRSDASGPKRGLIQG